MPYTWPEKARLFEAIGYQRRIETVHFGPMDYPVPVVRQFHQSGAKVKIALAPARTSKSYAAAADICPDILDFDNPEKHLIVGPDYDKASKEFGYVADWLVHRRKETSEILGAEIPEPLEYTNKPHQGRMRIVWPWGTELHAKSAVHLSSVLGESWGAVILSEACELPPETFYRGLRTRSRRFIIPTTPGLTGLWVKELWEDAQRNEDPNTALFQFVPEANPLYDMTRFKEELKRCGMDDPYFREQFLGEWVFYGGRVFPAFQPDPVESMTELQVKEWGKHPTVGNHCIDIDPLWIPKDWKRIAGMDFGFQDPTVYLWAAVAPNGDVLIYDEHYESSAERGWSTRQQADAIHRHSRENGTLRIDDCLREPKGAGALVARDYMVEHGIWNRPVQTADRMSSRLHLQAYLEPRADTKIPSLRIIKAKCPNLVKELIGLHYEDKEEQPREGAVERWRGSDHAVDACIREGTSIQTEFGERAIEDICVGDRVFTRRGLRYVTATGCMGWQRTFRVVFRDGRELYATADHPLWDEASREFVPVDSLRYALCLSWSLKNENTGLMIVPDTGEAGVGSSIETCGSRRAGPFQRAITSIIEITTALTMLSRIWNALQPKRIAASIRGSLGMACSTILNEFARGLLSGTTRPRVARGMPSTGRDHGEGAYQSLPSVSSAALPMSHCYRAVSAERTARQNHAVKVASTTRRVLARCVAWLSDAIAMPDNAPVVAPVLQLRVEPGPHANVYDLTVEGEHEYFAAGILVSNCRYLLSSRPSPRLIKEDPEEYAYRLETLRKRRMKSQALRGQIGWRKPGNALRY